MKGTAQKHRVSENTVRRIIKEFQKERDVLRGENLEGTWDICRSRDGEAYVKAFESEPVEVGEAENKLCKDRYICSDNAEALLPDKNENVRVDLCESAYVKAENCAEAEMSKLDLCKSACKEEWQNNQLKGTVEGIVYEPSKFGFDAFYNFWESRVFAYMEFADYILSERLNPNESRAELDDVDYKVLMSIFVALTDKFLKISQLNFEGGQVVDEREDEEDIHGSELLRIYELLKKPGVRL